MFYLPIVALFFLTVCSKDHCNSFNSKIYHKKPSSTSAFDKAAKTSGTDVIPD